MRVLRGKYTKMKKKYIYMYKPKKLVDKTLWKYKRALGELTWSIWISNWRERGVGKRSIFSCWEF